VNSEFVGEVFVPLVPYTTTENRGEEDSSSHTENNGLKLLHRGIPVQDGLDGGVDVIEDE
jgi:hypothetical protein